MTKFFSIDRHATVLPADRHDPMGPSSGAVFVRGELHSPPTRNHLFAAVLAVCSGGTLFGDTIVLRDGSRRAGNVRSCDEEHCSLDGKRIELSAISRIEFRNVSVPSSVRPNSVLQTDGTIVEGVFTGLSLGSVYVGDREIDRDVVAVIFIEAPPAPPAPEPEPPPPVVQPTQPQPETPPPASSAPPPPVTPPSAPPRPPSTSSRSRSTPAERMWTGRMRGLAWGTVDSCRSRLNIEVIVRLREHVAPLPGPDGSIIGTATLLNPTGSTVRNRGGKGWPGHDLSQHEERSAPDGQRNRLAAGSGMVRVERLPRRQSGIRCHLQERATFELVAIQFHLSRHWRSADHPKIAFQHPAPRYVQEGRMSGAFVTAATGAR